MTKEQLSKTFLLMVQSFPKTSKPWRIAEAYTSCDGMRTRLSSFCFGTEDEAVAKIKELEEKAAGEVYCQHGMMMQNHCKYCRR